MILPFDHPHLDRLYPNLLHVVRRRVDFWGLDVIRKGFAMSAKASTLVLGGEVFACVAVAEVRPGIGSLSGLFHKDARRLHAEAVDEAAEMFFRQLGRNGKFKAIFADAYLRVPASARWLESLGFRAHGPQYVEPAPPGDRLTHCQGYARFLGGEQPCRLH